MKAGRFPVLFVIIQTEIFFLTQNPGFILWDVHSKSKGKKYKRCVGRILKTESFEEFLVIFLYSQ